MILDLEETFLVGEDTFFESVFPDSSHGVVFEDDLNSGYLYAVETKSDTIFLDAVYIYNVANVIDKEKPCKLQIKWTDNGQFASLLINNYCHAIFDFKNKNGYCRTAFPDSNGDWAERKKLTDDLITDLLKEHYD